MLSKEDEEIQLNSVQVLPKFISVFSTLWNEFSKVPDLNRHVAEGEVSRIEKVSVSIIFAEKQIAEIKQKFTVRCFAQGNLRKSRLYHFPSRNQRDSLVFLFGMLKPPSMGVTATKYENIYGTKETAFLRSIGYKVNMWDAP